MSQHSVRAASDNLVRRTRAWAPATKVAALFLFPLPLLVAFVAGLVQGDASKAGLTAGALAALWGAGLLAARGVAAEAQFLLGEIAEPPGVPLKRLSMTATVAGVSLTALAAGHAAPMIGILALLALAGHLAFFGRDLRPARVRVIRVESVDAAALERELQRACARLASLDAVARRLAVPELGERLSQLSALGRAIVAELGRRPREAPRARRFLGHYLEEAERLALEYARTHVQGRTASLEPRFRALLQDLEHRFEEQHRALLEHDLLALDVDIEVLSARLERERPDVSGRPR